MEAVINFITELFLTNGIVIAMGCFIVGQIIKHWIPDEVMQNRFIPAICGVLGAALGVMIPGIFPDTHPIICAIQGLALGWAATGGVETIKGLKEGAIKSESK